MILTISQILKNNIFGPYFYEYFQDDIKLFKKFIKINEIKENDFIVSDDYELIFIFKGSFKLFYKNELICNIFPTETYIVGEESYLNATKKEKIFPHLIEIKADTDMKYLSLNLEKFESFSDNLKIYLAEKIFKDLTHKIILLNSLLEKYKKINKIIKSYFSSFDKNISIFELEKKINSIIKENLNKKSKCFISNFYEIEKIFFKKNKNHIKKKFTFLKRKIIPQIPPLEFLPENLIYQIAKNGIWIKYLKDETIITQGEKSDGSFFIIIKGDVNVIVNNEVINTLKGCFIIGEMTLIQQPGQLSIRTATLKANDTTYAIKIDSNILKSYHSQNKLYFYNSIIFQLFERFKDLNEKIYNHSKIIKNFIDNLFKSEQINQIEYKKLKNSIFTITTNLSRENILL